MKIFISTDIRVFQYGDLLYAQEKHATILKRYYDAFGKITLCARASKIDNISKGYVDITNIVEDILVIGSLSKMLLGVYRGQMREKIKKCDLVIGRCPSIAAYKAADIAKKLKKPFFAESMGCAWDAYWNHGIAGKAIAPYMFMKMKSVVKNADYALYVTSEFLQKRYPCKNESVAASNVLISKSDNSVLKARISNIESKATDNITLMTTAAVDVRYKGQEYVIRAIPKLNAMGISVKYFIVGEGNPDYLKSVAQKCGVSNQVVFVGRIPLGEVLDLLDQIDIYIQPSLQEGLPRSVIEAMSRGCPCIGARTAGIPELIEDKFVVRRKNVSDIAVAIKKYCDMSIEERCAVSKRNFKEAEKYSVDVLNKRRSNYFSRIASEIGENNARR